MSQLGDEAFLRKTEQLNKTGFSGFHFFIQFKKKDKRGAVSVL